MASVVVEAVPGAEGFRPGDRVLALCGEGGWSDCVRVSARSAAPVPASLDPRLAACLTWQPGFSG